ncbi:mediator of RNA polymerase II transcription subunit 30-like [Branchiostoma floridae]|uniref:Mediator of RNA polymerase II transcription subunit 30 n=1 Tax=Branchiostoma floridae TaxID=7739 RepID=A0A9J7HIQ0_BRAFL|nr:mediator of RNA polymerase II transcription subunit 30-like [Branchiostoma floridae]
MGQRSKSSHLLVMMNPKDRHPAPHPQGAFSGTAGKEVNTASLCRIGQETVQEIVSKTQEVFGLLKTWQLPNGVNPNIHQERQTKLQDLVRQMEVLFRKLRLIYEKCHESTAGLQHSNIEALVPYVEHLEGKHEDSESDSVRYVNEERRDVVEKVKQKNQQLKVLMDQLRELIWDVNAMMVANSARSAVR